MKGCLWFFVVCLLLFWWCGDHDGGSNTQSGTSSSSQADAKLQNGYNMCLSILNAPTTAVLLSYTDEKSTAIAIQKTGYNIKVPYSCMCYEIEAQNAFGGRVTNTYMILFQGDKPIYVDAAPKVNQQSVYAYFMAASINTGIDTSEIFNFGR